MTASAPPPPPVARSEAYQALLATLAGQLFQSLERRRPLHLRLGAAVPATDRKAPPHIADLAVTDQPARPDRVLVSSPLLIIDIVGAADDPRWRQARLADYRAVPDLREVVLLGETKPYAEIHRRFERARWMTDLLLDPGARLRLDSIGLELALGQLYRDLAREPALPKGRR
jgi:Uma2 family endonuclease